MRISDWSSDVCSSDLGAQAASLVLRPAIMLGYASALILLVASGKMRWLVARLAAAGRMALTNYLASSIVLTTIFYGYGGGWFGAFSRAALVPFVLAMWALTLAWSAPWLARFAYGPVERSEEQQSDLQSLMRS